MVKQKTPEQLKRIELSHKLTKLRLERNLNPYSIAKLANLNPSVTLSIELGSTNFSIDSFLKYIEALDVDIQFVDRSSTVS
ncbi:MAG: helix-turn-helix transcriptional regulator [Saprospiraceae bacterium]|uniref:Helix-turn-helix transcriptional regulator n=1 Tax=Candidatus Defluviibacterium haderslevense TaxID=2981993 RepID=A0A9D7SAK3_9BACT|nr:helix-turn-helix transcriptional regulator [Candidatus Defluviibacterium haderslevense]